MKATAVEPMTFRVASAPLTSMVPPAAPSVRLSGWLCPAAAANDSWPPFSVRPDELLMRLLLSTLRTPPLITVRPV